MWTNTPDVYINECLLNSNIAIIKQNWTVKHEWHKLIINNNNIITQTIANMFRHRKNHQKLLLIVRWHKRESICSNAGKIRLWSFLYSTPIRPTSAPRGEHPIIVIVNYRIILIVIRIFGDYKLCAGYLLLRHNILSIDMIMWPSHRQTKKKAIPLYSGTRVGRVICRLTTRRLRKASICPNTAVSFRAIGRVGGKTNNTNTLVIHARRPR